MTTTPGDPGQQPPVGPYDPAAPPPPPPPGYPAPPGQQAPPAYGRPGQPAFGQPPFGQPQSGQPVYGQPAFGGQQYGEPGALYNPAYGAGPIHPFGSPADFGERALSWLWDLLYLWPAWLLYVVGLTVVITGSASIDESVGASNDGPAVVIVIGAVLLFIGFVVQITMYIRNYVLDQGRTGYTYGRRKVGIRCVDQNTGQSPGGGSCFGRWLLHGFINQFFYIDYLWVAFDANKQSLTDKALHTVVVRQPAPAAVAPDPVVTRL